MAVIRVSLDELISGELALGDCVATLGTFDGTHCGHVELLEQARRLAAANNAKHIAFTFDCLPLEFLRPQAAPPLITSHATRLALLSRYADNVIVTAFDRQLAELAPERFVTDVLANGLGCVGIVAGFSHTFGKNAAGNTALLERIGARLGIQVRVVPPVLCQGRQVSSTLIRQLLAEGDVDTAAQMLGRPHALDGNVVSGSAQGRLIAFPTANINSEPRVIVPAQGVYITEVWRGGSADPAQQRVGAAVTAISDRPTFRGVGTSIESFILDYHGDLYGAQISVRFLQRLRGIVRFNSAQELQNQIELDVAAARDYFNAFTRVGHSGKLVR